MYPKPIPLTLHDQHPRLWFRRCALALSMLASSAPAQTVPERPRAVPTPAPVTSAADARKLADAEKEVQAERRARRMAEEAAQAEKQKAEELRKQLASARAEKLLTVPATQTVATGVPTPTGIAAQRPGQPVNLKAGATFKDSANGVESPLMVVIPPTGPGGFMMGSPASEAGRDSDEKQHRVTLSQPFALSQTEVTWAQWEICTSSGGCTVAGESKPTPAWGTGRQPVINVSWNQASAFAQWLNSKLGFAANDPYRYRLPSEAEWEYAARGGNTGPFGFGKDSVGRERNISADLANYGANFSYDGSPKGKYWAQTGEVASYPANAYGLNDMHGNVWEWVADCSEDDYDKLPDAVKTKGAAHRENDAGCPNRVLRGGSWFSDPRYLRAASRIWDTPTYRYFYIGFRLARMLPAGS